MTTTTKALAPHDGSNANDVEPTRGSQYFLPSVDIFETDDELTLLADVPGVAPNDVDLHFENGELILQGKVTAGPSHDKLLAGEYQEGDFFRVFRVHESIDSTKIGAECKNGVLTVHLPKVEKARPRKVLVKG